MGIIIEMFLPLVCSFILTYLFGKIMIPVLHKMKYGQSIREEGPKTHMKKQGTPTIGGVIFIVPTFLITICYSIFYVKTLKNNAIFAMISFLAFGFIGFLDDYLKIKRRKNLGLRAYQKMILLLVVTYIIYLLSNDYSTVLYIPVLNLNIELLHFYLPFLFLYFTGVTNAVNLTDGLDGLATTVTIIVLTFLFLASFVFGDIDLGIFIFILIGALMAFLIFNINPARVFMGDTGSLALGGAVSVSAFILGIEVILILVGIVYVVETLSVIIQVISYKLTKKRVFKMAPIHHHFEHIGWSENKVVYVFGIVTLIACVLSFLLL